MTVIAYNGHSIAADCQSTQGEMRLRAVKLIKADGRIYSYTGRDDIANAMMAWHRAGADHSAFQPGWAGLATLIVIDGRSVSEYAGGPDATPIYNKLHAWGAGALAALGAMHHGASPAQACRTACKLVTTCGGRIKTIQLSRSAA
jgi:hypothetical protein